MEVQHFGVPQLEFKVTEGNIEKDLPNFYEWSNTYVWVGTPADWARGDPKLGYLLHWEDEEFNEEIEEWEPKERLFIEWRGGDDFDEFSAGMLVTRAIPPKFEVDVESLF